MNLIQNAASYLGKPVEYAVGVTTGGYPQFAVKLAATHIWDEESKTWVDFAEYEQEITAYLVLFGGDGTPTLNCKQIMKVFGWEGDSYKSLNDGDYSELQVQFRVESEEYNGKARLKVAWIDSADAPVGSSIKKLDAGELSKMDSIYGAGLKQLKNVTPVKASAVPAGKPSVPKVAPKATPPAAAKMPVEAKKTIKKGAPAAEQLTKEQAWEKFAKCYDGQMDDQAAGDAWLNAIMSVYGKPEDEAMTPAQWAKVKDKAIEISGVTPF